MVSDGLPRHLYFIIFFLTSNFFYCGKKINLKLETFSFHFPGARPHFTKMSSSTINSHGVPYDYDSVMHYHSTAFGNGRTTITRKDGSTNLGDTRGLSPKDIQQAKLMYCNRQPTSRPACYSKTTHR